MDRVILHCDLNNFYASVETILHPEYKGKPIAFTLSRIGEVNVKNTNPYMEMDIMRHTHPA